MGHQTPDFGLRYGNFVGPTVFDGGSEDPVTPPTTPVTLSALLSGEVQKFQIRAFFCNLRRIRRGRLQR